VCVVPGIPEYESEGGEEEEGVAEDSDAEEGGTGLILFCSSFSHSNQLLWFHSPGKSGFADAMSKILAKTVAKGDVSCCQCSVR